MPMRYLNDYCTIVYFQILYDMKADVILTMTCSIRENAEKKVWSRLDYFKSLKRQRSSDLPPLQIGILGKL